MSRALGLVAMFIAGVLLVTPRAPARPAPALHEALDGLARDGADLFCLFGVPTPAQRDRADALGPLDDAAPADQIDLARALLIRAGAARSDAARATLAARAHDVALRADPATSRAEAERFILLAVARLLAPDAAPSDAADAFDHLFDAKGVLRSNRSLRDPAFRLQLHITCATVLTALLERGPDAALGVIERVRTEPPFIDDDRPSPLGQLLLADLACRAHLAAAAEAPSGAPRRRALADACTVYARLAQRRDLGIDPAPLAIAKLAQVLPPGAPIDELPPIAALAAARAGDRAGAADVLSRALERRPAPPWRADIAFELGMALAQGDPAEQARAADVLTEFAASHPADPRAGRAVAAACTAAAASNDAQAQRTAFAAAHRFPPDPDVPHDAIRLRLASLLADDERLQDALAVLDRVPDDAAPALDARRLGVQIARRLVDRSPGARASAEQLRDVATRALTLADAREAPRAEFHAALAEAALALDDPEAALREATAALDDPTPPAAPAVAAAGVMVRAALALDRPVEAREHLARLAALDAESSGGRAVGAIERAAWRAASLHTGPFAADRSGTMKDAGPVEALRLVLTWATEHAGDPNVISAAAYRLAYAELLAGDAAGAAARAAGVPPGGVDDAARLTLLGEARLAAGDDAAAFAAFTTLARGLEARSPAPEAYWQAWTRILEILDRQNDGGERTPTIKRRLTLLGARADWGACAPCAPKLGALRQRYLGEARAP